MSTVQKKIIYILYIYFFMYRGGVYRMLGNNCKADYHCALRPQKYIKMSTHTCELI